MTSYAVSINPDLDNEKKKPGTNQKTCEYSLHVYISIKLVSLEWTYFIIYYEIGSHSSKIGLINYRLCSKESMKATKYLHNYKHIMIKQHCNEWYRNG